MKDMTRLVRFSQTGGFFFFFVPVNFQSFMLRASPLMHILSLLLTAKLQGRSIFRALCYAPSLQHVV